MPIAGIYTCAAMLFVAVAPLPYGYYTLLRFVACGVFAFAAHWVARQNARVLPWVFGLLALTFNPIYKIHFPKEIWAMVDIASGILLLCMTKRLRAPSEHTSAQE